MILLIVSILVGAALIAHQLHRGFRKMTPAFQRVVDEVAEVRGVASSAVAALNAFVTAYKAALANSSASEDAALNQLADDMAASIAPLAQAIQQNPAPTDPGGDTTSGADTTSGDDTATAGDTASGGAGDDSVAGSGADDSLSGGTGDDSVQT